MHQHLATVGNFLHHNMTRYLLLIISFFISISSYAENSDFEQAVARFKTSQNVKAKAVRIFHLGFLNKNVTSHGSLSISAPNKMNITVAKGKEQLDMTGNDFTIMMFGLEHKTSSISNAQFKTFQAVLTAIINGTPTLLNGVKGIDISKSGDLLTISIDPSCELDKDKKPMFTSYTITLDCKSGVINTLRLNRKGKSYIEYTFSDSIFH